jgi:hypothetical protein
MSATPKMVSATVTTDFNDAGSDRKFAAGEAHEFTTGEFANYRAAGLVEASAEKPVADAPSPPAKPKRPRASRAKAKS